MQTQQQPSKFSPAGELDYFIDLDQILNRHEESDGALKNEINSKKTSNFRFCQKNFENCFLEECD